MNFNANSGLVKIWVENVKHKGFTKDEVPKMFNLREVVYAELDKLTAQ